MKRSSGVSLMEYGLIGGTIALVALPALLMLGQQLSSRIESMIPAPGVALASGSEAPVNAPLATEAAVRSSSSSSSSSSSFTAPPDVTALLSPSDLTSTVQTAGVNGATTLLADSLVAMSNKLKAEGSIDDELYNSIVALANKGHTLAGIEASIETAAKDAGNGGGWAFDETSVELNGKTYSGPELVAMLESNSSDVKEFRKLQDKVLNTESLNDPELKSVLSQLSDNILNIAAASALSGDWISGDGSGINTYESFVSDLPDMMTSYAEETTGNSNRICATKPGNPSCLR